MKPVSSQWRCVDCDNNEAIDVVSAICQHCVNSGHYHVGHQLELKVAAVTDYDPLATPFVSLTSMGDNHDEQRNEMQRIFNRRTIEHMSPKEQQQAMYQIINRSRLNKIANSWYCPSINQSVPFLNKVRTRNKMTKKMDFLLFF